MRLLVCIQTEKRRVEVNESQCASYVHNNDDDDVQEKGKENILAAKLHVRDGSEAGEEEEEKTNKLMDKKR